MIADPDDCLEACDIVGFRNPAVLRLFRELAGADVRATTRRCFGFVRDEIRHSSD